MIHRIFSSLPTFKELTFSDGLNLLVVNTTAESSDLQTRNRAGKSSFVEIVHFLTGANTDPNSLFRSAALSTHSFGIDLDLAGARTSATRSGSRPSRIRLHQADTAGWPEVPERDLESEYLSNEEWKRVLGTLWFRIDVGDETPYSPSVRTLFPYFARRDPGGFLSPFKHFSVQGRGDIQVAISYLLGLDWTIPRQLQVIRDQESSLQALRRAAMTGAMPGPMRPSGEIRSPLAVAEQRARRATSLLDEFHVLPEYADFEAEATDLTIRLNDAADTNTADQRLLSRLQEALEEEPETTNGAEVVRLYEQAGLELPGLTLQRLEDVQAFHSSIVANRRGYLEQEANAAETRMAERRPQMAQWDDRRAEIMLILQSHGALSQFAQLQAEVARLQSQAAELRREFEAAERFEGTRADLEIERSQLARRLHQDFSEREEVLREAIVTFQEVSSALYEEAGALEITETQNGPDFSVRIQGEASHGVRNMQIFCMDMTMMKMCAARGVGPGFLIHDSHLFDGVDERQVGHALAVAQSMASDLGFQYIATMNSDDIPSILPAGFDLREHIVPVRLTDADDGGLFGIRF